MAQQGHSGAGAGPGPIVGSAPVSNPNLNSSGYFSQPYLQAQAQQQPHSYAAPSHLPARSPYTDSQNFMPSTQNALSPDDDQTYQNTLANSQAATAAPSTQATPAPYHQQQQQHQYYGDEAGGPSGTSTGAMAAAAAVNGGRFNETWDASQRGSSIMDGDGGAYSDGGVSGTSTQQLPTRSNTLKKKSSLRRASSLHRSGSRRSMKAGSVRSLALQSRSDSDESHSAFYCPVPTKGNPTEVLAARFHAWRKILKDLISYHREIQSHYEQRAKSLQRLAATLNGSTLPPGFMTTGGLDDAAQQLRNFHKQAVSEAMKAREIEEDVILALTGLRTDLSQKIKEIKNISGDFRNNVDKEMDTTKKAVKNLQDNLGQAELDSSLSTGRQDPYLLRLMADRQLERQIQEENYLHQAFLNLEKSGRELESIVVGEIQKSYNAYVGILKREAGATWATVDELREGPIAMPKDQEWLSFIRNSDQFINPEIPIRSFQFITYPGQNHFACQEIRAGLLERKSKYLKSYTAGWYVLSPTHLHEFKSADKMQAPVMSLYLPEQKLGSHSNEGASSSKFVLKGRQTGGLHRGHTWVFRAESYDTMMAWFDDLYALTEKTPQEREDFARGHQQLQHTRSISRNSQHTYSSDGVVNEDDDEPFAVNSPAAMAGAAGGAKAAEDAYAPGSGQSASGVPLTQQTSVVASDPGMMGTNSVGDDAFTPGTTPGGASSQYRSQSASAAPSRRPSQGGRFPSDLQVNAQRGLEVQAAGIPISPTSAGGSGSQRGSATAADSTYGHLGPADSVVDAPSAAASDYGVIAAAGAIPGSQQHDLAPGSSSYDNNNNNNTNYAAYGAAGAAGVAAGAYGAAGAAGVAAGAYGAESWEAQQQKEQQLQQQQDQQAALLAQQQQTELDWRALRAQQEQLRLDQQRLYEQQEQQRQQMLLVQQQQQQQQQQTRAAQPAVPQQTSHQASHEQTSTDGTSQATLASRAQQAPPTVAPVIPMFVNVNDKSSPVNSSHSPSTDRSVNNINGPGSTTGDSGKAFNSSSDVAAAGLVGAGAGVVGGAAGAFAVHGYPNGVAREQQVYSSETQPTSGGVTTEAPFAATTGTTATVAAVGGANGTIGKEGNLVDHSAFGSGDRPSLADRKGSTATTLSHLHIPGEFPKTPAESR
ncbi:phosphatidylinositol 4,5-bisphosphate-binding protein [Sporothrix stenoceras]|uniref:Phosphatidylinositol 4,5-bisphosphate-binding protein n=1 Tax=Sporothrix stenoceras TaxID=5173 RepID=A0ABR3ZK36_9PEZI